MFSNNWKKKIFGSLQSRIEVSVFGIVLAGFTAASSSSLLLNQRVMFDEHQKRLAINDASFSKCITKSIAKSSSFEDCIGYFEKNNIFIWINNNRYMRSVTDGGLEHIPIQLLELSKKAERIEAKVNIYHSLFKDDFTKAKTFSIGQRQYILQQYAVTGHRLKFWTAADITASALSATNYLAIMFAIWSVMLLVIVILIGIAVRRVLKPLQYLVSQADIVNAENLSSIRLEFIDPPIEVRLLAQSYNQLLDRLSNSWSQQRQFVSSVSHELRTPLTILSGYLKRVLRRGSNLTDNQRKELLIAQEESNRIIRMISDLLDLSRNESAKLEIYLYPMSLFSPLQEVIEMAENSMKRNIKFRFPSNMSDCEKNVSCNADRLKQIVLNLLENANKYSSDKTPLKVELISLADAMLVVVIDEGVGIPKGEEDQIFQRFYRGSNVTDTSGTGLGLSVVRMMVEAMNALIFVESEIGRGTRFSIRFPLIVEPSINPIAVNLQ